ncbi:MAG: hypothetical protein O3B90_04560, partial [Actinomycetota bacterium]|nr:hypothetical protein [Actinomycetota bacterium]
MSTTSPKFVFTEGTNRYRAYKFAGFAMLALLVLIVAFAYNDTGSITLFDNSYKLSITRVTKCRGPRRPRLGLQVVA